MVQSPKHAIYTRLTETVVPGGHLVHVWPLEGGVSADAAAMEITEPGGQSRKLVVRIHGERDRTENPDVAQRTEFSCDRACVWLDSDLRNQRSVRRQRPAQSCL